MSSEWWAHLRDEYRAKNAIKASQAQIDAAVKVVQGMTSSKKDPNKIPTIWDQPKSMPTISDVDFGDVEFANPALKSLLASNKFLKRDRLLWHVQNPGKALNVNDFTHLPLCCQTSEGITIIDGHHRLAALILLGVNKTQVYNLPLN